MHAPVIQGKSQGNTMFGNLEEKDEFLYVARLYLKSGLFEKAVLLAQKRLEQLPGDIDARLVMGHSLVKMGKTEEALEFLKSVEDDILRWSVVFELLGDVYVEKNLTEEATKAYRRFVSLKSGLPVDKGVSSKLDSLLEKSNVDIPVDEGGTAGAGDVPAGFHTITLAELYVKQGHLEMARDVLREIVKADPGAAKAVQMLKDVDSMLKGKKTEALSEERRAFVVAELGKWLKNLEKSKRYEAIQGRTP